MKSVISASDASLEKPAACRWPPPPDLRAIAETSSSSVCARRLTLCFGALSVRGGSRMSAAIAAPSTERRKSMIPSA